MDELLEGIQGLTSKEVEEQKQKGNINIDDTSHGRSIKSIIVENICTLFNLINVILFAFIAITGSFKNGLFMLVIVINTAIGIVQEIRSKKITDALSIVASSKSRAIRDGEIVSISHEDIVKGDYLIFGRGEQIPCDATVVAGSAQLDESLLTGESNLIPKTPKSELFSGSFVNSGTVVACVQHVGAENYASKISAEAKAHKEINSEIMTSLNKIIKFVSIMIFPVGLLLFSSMHFGGGIEFDQAVLSSVAALVGMVPEGLILLTSSVLALSVIRLSKYKVLVQQLYCIETLAHVDTLCLDKTGTITSGAMEVEDIELINKTLDEKSLTEIKRAILGVISSDVDTNETGKAILEWGRTQSIHSFDHIKAIPFSSDKKWSGASLENGKHYVIGAGQFILKDDYHTIEDRVVALSSNSRVLVFAEVDGFDDTNNLIGTPTPLAFVMIKDQIRSSAPQTIKYFIEQGVSIKVISGDDPRTVAGIAQQVGVPHSDKFIDATTLKTDEDIARAIEHNAIFGRVKPEQKKAFVKELQKKGHTTAMTGDGVNDTLALKQADCSVAMAAGSDAARNVAQLVLVDNDFASMPQVVAEGRRSINNLQRSASLFFVKTLFSIFLGIIFIVLPWQYPYQPIQMTLISAFTIGIPSFVLALEPNHNRIKGHFLENVVVKSIPGALAVIASVLSINVIGYMALGLDYGQVSTLCVLTTAFIGANLIARISIPFTPTRAALLVFVIVGCGAGAFIFPHLFGIAPLTSPMIFALIAVALSGSVLFHILYTIGDVWHKKRMDALV